jgi:hypothetical protein
MHGLKVNSQFQNYDKIYDDAIAPIKDYLYPPVQLPKYSIFEDVMNCNNTTDLRIIKLKIHDKKYIEQEV